MPRHAQIPLLAASDNRLGKNDYKVLIALSAHADRNGKCHPKRETLAAITGIHVVNISKITTRLTAFGWLKKVGDGGRSAPVDYLLVTPETVAKTATVYEPETVAKTATKTVAKTATGKQHTNEQKKKYIKKKNGAFRKPTPEEVAAYAKGIGFNLDGNRFVDYYQSKGWMVGKTGMKDWQAAVRTWKRNSKNANSSESGKSRNEIHGEVYREIAGDIAAREKNAAAVRGVPADVPRSVDEKDRDCKAGDRGIPADLGEGAPETDGRGHYAGVGCVGEPIPPESQGVQGGLFADTWAEPGAVPQAPSGAFTAETETFQVGSGWKH